MATKTRSSICVSVLVSLIISEYCLAALLNESSCCSAHIILGIVSAIWLMVCLRILFLRKSIKWPSISVFRKIFQSIVSSWLPLVILFFFLIHIEWISNAGYDAFFGESAFDWRNLVIAVVGILSIFISICLYPFETKSKAPNERSLMICGLSLDIDKSEDRKGQYIISPRNIDLLAKPFINREWHDYNEDYTSGAVSQLVILPSLEELPPFKDLSEDEEKAGIFNYCLYSDIRTKYNQIIQSDDTKAEIIKKLIFLLTGKDVNVIIAESVLYDDMENSIKRINAELDKYERTSGGLRDTGNTLLYISPGTGVIGSALTAFSIPGNRMVLYYTQTKKNNHLIPIGLQTGAYNSIVQEIVENS